MVGLEELKRNKMVVTCTKCKHQCLPWQVGSTYEKNNPQVLFGTNKCTECNEIDCAIYSQDTKLALEIWNKSVKE
jgi:hypothetical protein